jgi:hypothetical protein
MKIVISTSANNFLPFDKPDTSSRGPGCLYIDTKTTKKAIGQNPSMISNKRDKMVNTVRAVSLSIDLAAWPPSSCPAGNRMQ